MIICMYVDIHMHIMDHGAYVVWDASVRSLIKIIGLFCKSAV